MWRTQDACHPQWITVSKEIKSEFIKILSVFLTVPVASLYLEGHIQALYLEELDKGSIVLDLSILKH